MPNVNHKPYYGLTEHALERWLFYAKHLRLPVVQRLGAVRRFFLTLALVSAVGWSPGCASQQVPHKDVYDGVVGVPIDIALPRASGTGMRWSPKNIGPFDLAEIRPETSTMPGGETVDVFRLTPREPGRFLIDWELGRPGVNAVTTKRSVIVVRKRGGI